MAATSTSDAMETQVSARVATALDEALDTFRYQHEYPPTEAQVIRTAVSEFLDGDSRPGGETFVPDEARERQITVKLTDELLTELDAFRNEQPFAPSRSEVVRRAVASYLAAALDEPLPA